MPLANVRFAWSAASRADHYEIFRESTRIAVVRGLSHESEIDLAYGEHRFSVRGVNADGPGPFRSATAIFEEPYVPNPPGPIGEFNVSLVLMGGGVGGGEPPTNSTPYDLSGYSVPFSYSWPTAPTTTSSATVTPATLAANNVNGRELTLQAGSYGDVSAGDDQRWILQAGAEIDTFSTVGSNRVEIKGENARDGLIGAINTDSDAGSGTTDILIDGVTLAMDATWSGSIFNSFRGQRIALVNSSITSVGYSLYMTSQITLGVSNAIVAGNYIHQDTSILGSGGAGGQGIFRALGLKTAVIVGNYFLQDTPTDGALGVRFHTNDLFSGQDTGSYDVYFGDNIVVGGTLNSGLLYIATTGGGSYVPDDMRDYVAEDNDLYARGGILFRYDGPQLDDSVCDNLVLQNNNGYSGSFAGWPPNPADSAPYDLSTWTITGNTSQAIPTLPTPASKLGWTP